MTETDPMNPDGPEIVLTHSGSCPQHPDWCPGCGTDLGWITDESACGDPDHCAQMYPCPVCNPGGLD